MKTVLDLYNEESHKLNPKGYESFIGLKVKVLEYKDGTEQWSKKNHTILSFIENACGEGCCHAFLVSDLDEEIAFSSSQLLVLES